MGMSISFTRDSTPRVMRGRLAHIARSHTLRCDAKQLEERFTKFDTFIESVPSFALGDVLPAAFVKGAQPRYIESLEVQGVPVISTIAIQNLGINVDACRFITQDDFDAIEDARKPKENDVLLTMDGGTSIGKPTLFDLDSDFAIDSHVAILRPVGLHPRVLVYLLASPLGQLQFQRAESGASGQTGVTEDDVRRFRFPLVEQREIEKLVSNLNERRAEIARQLDSLRKQEEDAWSEFNDILFAQASGYDIVGGFE